MAGRIKGITVEIGGDTTGLGKALQNVNKEIKEALNKDGVWLAQSDFSSVVTKSRRES